MYISVLLLLVAASTVLSIDLSRTEVLRKPDLSTPGSVNSQPEVSWGTNATHIEVQLAYPSLGWIALGLSPNGGMDQSDVLFGYVDDKTHEVVIQDRYILVSNNRVNLSLDIQQDWKAISGSQNDTHTVLRAVRKLKTCDQTDRQFTSSATPVLFSFNMRDPKSKTDPIKKHNDRGTSSINFLQVVPDKPPTEPIVGTLNFTMGNVKVTGNSSTNYFCRIIKMPKFTIKTHAVSVSPIIDPRNADILHHVLAFACAHLPAEYQSPDLPVFECGPATMSLCQQMIGGWATGGGTNVYPAEAGLPFTPEMSGQYVLLQTHYNNPQLRSSVDDSGFSYSLTDQLRKYDIGNLITGIVNFDYVFTLPPGEESFQLVGQCSDQCTSLLPKDGIQIVSALMHMHTRGTMAVARHFRAGQELPPIVKDSSFNYNFQSPLQISPSRRVLPGDRIITECTFTTASEKDDNFVFGGEATTQEMCLGFFSYYPASDLSLCGAKYNVAGYLSAIEMPAKDILDGGLDVKPGQNFWQALNSAKPKEIMKKLSMPVMDHVMNSFWEGRQVDKLEKFYRSKQYTGICVTPTGNITLVTKDNPPFVEPLQDFTNFDC